MNAYNDDENFAGIIIIDQSFILYKIHIRLPSREIERNHFQLNKIFIMRCR